MDIELRNTVLSLITSHKEGLYWDFKQDWNDEKKSDLLKDILCFSNIPQEHDCYLIVGVSDDFQICGVKNLKKQSDIIDWLEKISFADQAPTVTLSDLCFSEGKIVQVITVQSTDFTPYYLSRRYNEIPPGVIYSRYEDRNTSSDSTADFHTVEYLWKRRFGLTKTPIDRLFFLLNQPEDWIEQDNQFYYEIDPDFTISFEDVSYGTNKAFYSYVLMDTNMRYKDLNLNYNGHLLRHHQLLSLDGGRLLIPAPHHAVIRSCDGSDKKLDYRYYVEQDPYYNLVSFFLEKCNGFEGRYDFNRICDYFILYTDEDERLRFENYISNNIQLVEERINGMKEPYFDDEGNKRVRVVVSELLRTGAVLHEICYEWREYSCQVNGNFL